MITRPPPDRRLAGIRTEFDRLWNQPHVIEEEREKDQDAWLRRKQRMRVFHTPSSTMVDCGPSGERHASCKPTKRTNEHEGSKRVATVAPAPSPIRMPLPPPLPLPPSPSWSSSASSSASPSAPSSNTLELWLRDWSSSDPAISFLGWFHRRHPPRGHRRRVRVSSSF